MGILNKILGTADGIREVTRDTYKRNVQMAQSNPQTDDPVHWVGLYGAIATRYAASGNEKPEVYIWAELAPFLLMNPNLGLDVLCEYLVYKEQPEHANVAYIKDNINSSIKSSIGTEILSLSYAGYLNRVTWSTWLEPDTIQILIEEMDKMD